MEESGDITVIRERVEKLSLNLFTNLKENDILFIDSSYIVKPQGDVLFLILEVLPSLKKGVYIHFYDICTPKDYFDEWIYNQYFWNEQYFLEAFLSNNENFEIVLAANNLFNKHKERLLEKCPILKQDLKYKPEREVGAFWIRKIK